jgi:hypothetical protein
MFKNELLIEFKRAIYNKKFWCCIMLAITLALLHYFQVVYPEFKTNNREIYAKNLYPVSTFEIWMGARGGLQSTIYYLMIPVLAILPYASSLFEDIKTGYIQNIIIRTSRKNFFLSKLIVSILVGGTLAVLPMVLNLYLTAMTVPSIKPEVTQKIFPAINMNCMFNELFYSRPYLYVGIYCLIIFAFASIFVVFCLMLAFYANNYIEVIIFHFLVYIFLDFVFEFLGKSNFSPRQIMRIDQDVEISGIITGIELIFCGTTLLMFYIRKVKNYEATI